MMDVVLSDVFLTLEFFHFMRPLWLLLLLPIAVLWWGNRRRAGRPQQPVEALAPHLRDALTVGKRGARTILPIDGVALVLALVVLGPSGPSWSRQVDPFTAQTGPLVIVLKVTPTMMETDTAPTRLERAKHKIRDLMALRAGARTALVAYAGTAHRVLPFTEDSAVMLPYLEGLVPEIMPKEGADASRAFAVASEVLATAEAPGGVLFVLDALDPTDADAFNAAVDDRPTFLNMLPVGLDDPGLASLPQASVIRVSADNRDVVQLDRTLNVDYRRALLEDQDQPWEDRGWLLAWPAAFLGLIWFRQGWTMRWAVVLLASGLVLSPLHSARAEGVVDWFLTPDQQGRIAYGKNNFAEAAKLFADPHWRSHALYRSGQYEAAIELLERQETPQAAYLQGLAHIKNRQYRDGVRAFETALERDPDYPGAAENLEIAQEIVSYIEETREASDTGEDTGIGADDEVFDNEANKGQETQIERQPNEQDGILTTEQWMNTVDTRTEDFLKYRFQVEASRPSE